MKNVLIDLALVEYQREYDRKSKLDSKTIGYITFISILMATSVGLFSLFFGGLRDNLIKAISVILVFAEIYFSIWALVFALIAHKMRNTTNIMLDKSIERLWEMKDENMIGSILKTIIGVNKENSRTNKVIEEKNEITYMFLVISVITFVVLGLWTVGILIGGIYG
jgi:hypothetical protein